jgi:hypothetical protein
MCGISGIALWKSTSLRPDEAAAAVAALLKLSERRGKEAAGLAIRTRQALSIFKRPMAAGAMVRTSAYRNFVREHFAEAEARDGALCGPLCTIAHARLVTNGRYGIAANNQPVISGQAVAVHNGIVVNCEKLWAENARLDRKAEVDSEIIPALIASSLNEGHDLAASTRRLYKEIEGEANIALAFTDRPVLLVATNTGSLYLAIGRDSGVLAFASERPILERFLARRPDFRAALGAHNLVHAGPGTAFAIDLSGGGPQRFDLGGSDAFAPPSICAPVTVRDPVAAEDARRRALKRCTHCVLPQTIPGISFDADGVCNFCRRYKPVALKGLDGLHAVADRHRRGDGRPDCVIGLSGGRDSSYGLHVLKRDLGLNPVAYTYDWALVTDLARRNQSRLCAKLGVEHVLVSADIAKKRRFIRRNVEAWASRPELGMVPLFMAGDKMYFYHYRAVAKRYDVKLIVTCGNRFEMTDFKSSFAGVTTNVNAEEYRPYNISWGRKLKFVSYYLRGFALNPRYLNESLPDTALGFYASYVMKHEMTRIFDYIPWDEQKIDRVLRTEYDWELASDTSSTWRIGDGTAAFYNYIYHSIAGFTEHDTFRSNQIRAGAISRDEALARLASDNLPRLDSIREYASVIGFDLDPVLAAIDMAPRLF